MSVASSGGKSSQSRPRIHKPASGRSMRFSSGSISQRRMLGPWLADRSGGRSSWTAGLTIFGVGTFRGEWLWKRLEECQAEKPNERALRELYADGSRKSTALRCDRLFGDEMVDGRGVGGRRFQRRQAEKLANLSA